MDSFNELPLSLSFASSSHQSIGSSSNHDRLLLEPDYDNKDAEIVVEGNSIGVNMSILAARSQYFRRIFLQWNYRKGKPKYVMSELVRQGVVGFEAFKVILNYLYTGNLQPSPREVSVCVDDNCSHDACGVSIGYFVELMYASSTFELKELVLLVQHRLLDFVEKALAEDVFPILVAAFHCQLSQLLSTCIQRVARSDLDIVAIGKELPREVSDYIKTLRLELLEKDESSTMEVDPVNDKRIRRMHMALDSDDVELVMLLLKESGTTLDDAYALHYAVAYCNPKVVREVLLLDLANINLCNPRGLTALHVAARRKQPAVIVALLDRGASASDTTSNGETAVAICRRLTRPKDFYEKTEQGQENNKARMCINLLEREMHRSSMSGSLSIISEVIAADDLHVRLDYLENRVAFARLLFPAEAKIANEMANVNSTLVDTGLKASRGSNRDLGKFDLNETPSGQTKRLQERMQALLRTVAMGRRFFPPCSEVLDKFLDDEMDVSYFIVEDPEEQKNKKKRFLELKNDVQKAFCKDMAENNPSVLTPSSSSSSYLNLQRRSESPFGDSVSSDASSISCWNRWLESESSFSESVSH